MNSIELDKSKLLGFKILAAQTGPRGGPRGESTRIGSKVGGKAPPAPQPVSGPRG